MKLKLPKPCEKGQYVLPDGSIIYPSANDFTRETGEHVRAPNPGAFMLWRSTGMEENVPCMKVAIGDFIMNHDGPMYFQTPMLALQHLEMLLP